jgi:guanine deaminase
MATLGGARVTGLSDEIGNFFVGKQFDALVVDMTSNQRGINTPLEAQDSPRTVLEKFVMTGDDRNISNVFVRSKRVLINT